MFQYLPMTVSALLLGGECTGKSELAGALAQVMGNGGYSTVVVPESLRAFVEDTVRTPAQEDQRDIWIAQSDALAVARASGVDLVVCDPAPLMTAVYSVQYFNDSSLLEPALAETVEADLVIWCQPDITWEPDGRHRDGPQAREASHRILETRVIPRLVGTPLIRVRGSLAERIQATQSSLASLLP